MLVLCGMKTRHYGLCSRALTTLENSELIDEESKKAFEQLAIDIFIRAAPIDPIHANDINCPKCDAEITRTASQCPECGEKILVCMASGESLSPEQAWRCLVCRHYVNSELLTDFSFCPFCHHPIPDEEHGMYE